MSSCTTSTVTLSESAAVSYFKLPAYLANGYLYREAFFEQMTKSSKPAAYDPIIFSTYNFSIPFSAMDQLVLTKICMSLDVTCCRPTMSSKAMCWVMSSGVMLIQECK